MFAAIEPIIDLFLLVAQKRLADSRLINTSVCNQALAEGSDELSRFNPLSYEGKDEPSLWLRGIPQHTEISPSKILYRQPKPYQNGTLFLS